MAKATAHPLAKTVKKVADAKPATPGAVLTLFKTVFIPLLPVILTEVLKSDKGGKYKAALREARTVLDEADLDK